ncbi:CHC2 zinc finger domain-containing protein [Spirochaeta isovalerica]|uniref:DNA primase catalytic core n=1 Tax=Spirochaeta isovalerica TaxID=150 RepID=A0A841RDH1_9SPIO|nr:CHC2 zinc finger domain-containing protein [Spirochaeta isovalerica]MBB6480887.1 DNA primase catalytic core [Spirochaeta isovalerica]MBB6480899.1 DNA primase catalytic core [Spirochaeta isovalerica]
MSSDRLGGVKTLKVSGFLDEFEKDEIKKRVDILSLFSSFGVSYEKKGRSHMAKCPWHDDDTPSLSIDQGKGLYNCFGCGESGDIFDLVQKMEGIDFKESLKYLKEFDGSIVPFPKTLEVPAEPVPSESHQPEGGSVENESAFDSVDLERVMEFYQRSLSSSREAMDYFKSRGIGLKVLSRFSVGYSNGKLKDLVSSGQKKALKEIGVFNEKGYETFKDCVVFPLLDSTGKVVSLYGRKIKESTKIKHLYLKGPHHGLLNRKAASVYRGEIILTESVIDALSLIQMGVENVIPCYGTNGFTDDHLSLLEDERVKLATIAFDNDAAGSTAAEKLGQRLLEEEIPVKLVYPSHCKDWNELLTLNGRKEDIKPLLDSAEVIYPKGKSPDFSVKKDKGKYLISASDITYRLLGVKELFVSNLKVNVRAERNEQSFIDNCDLYSARSRTGFSLQLSRLFDVESKRIEKDLIRMVEYLEEERDKALAGDEDREIELTEQEVEMGMEFLTSADLFDRIVQDTELLGYVGEEINKILIYLAASSRKLDDPISVIVMSESAAGKSYLIDTVKKLIPPEDVVSMTSLSDQALNYLPEGGLKHKFLVMGEAVHSEVVEHQIREMLSSHELSRLVTSKDEKTGQMTSKLVRKEVIVSAVMSSTDYDLNAENTSRSFVVNTDESTDQTRRIHASQKKKYSTDRLQVKRDEIPRIIKAHHAAQRLLKKVFIINPLAEKINFPDTLMRSRRDHDRFMDLIASVAFLRQYQKEEKEENGVKYIECDETDLEIAARIIKEILPATLTNFPKSAITLYGEIRRVIRDKAKEENLLPKEVSVTQRELRELTGLNQMFVKRNVKTLCDFEYLICTGSRTRGSRNAYRLVADESIELLDMSKLLKS